MIRFALRQFRAQGILAISFLVALGVILLITGPSIVHLYDTSVASCASHDDCQSATSSLLAKDRVLQHVLDILVIVVPGIIGVFWGAPLVAREIESGTFRLAWTQSIRRVRWLVIKLSIVGLASMITCGLLSLMVTWWSRPFDRVNNTPFSYFDSRDLVPLAYGAFAVVLGVTFGTIIRRTLPAMATTFVAFIAIRLPFTLFLRPHLISPLHENVKLAFQNVGFGIMNGGAPNLIVGSPNIASSSWVYSTQLVDKSGIALSPSVTATDCPSLVQSLSQANANTPQSPRGLSVTKGATFRAPSELQNALQHCVQKVGLTYHELVRYQPVSRYWDFQWYETGIYIALALLVSGVCVWQLKRRTS